MKKICLFFMTMMLLVSNVSGLVFDGVTADDAEQHLSDGNVNTSSSDLEFIYDKGGTPDTGDQMIGLRFENVAVPPNRTVTSAYIQFTGDAKRRGQSVNSNDKCNSNGRGNDTLIFSYQMKTQPKELHDEKIQTSV